MTDVSCYCHCDDYSSRGEHQCWLTIIKSLPQQSVWGNVMSLSPLRASSSIAQWETAELHFYLPCSVVSDKLTRYTYSLIILTKETPEIAMAPWNSLESRSIQRNDYRNYTMVLWLIIWLIMTTNKCLLWHACSIYFWCNYTNLLYFLLYLLVLVYVLIAQTVSSSSMIWYFHPNQLIWVEAMAAFF